MWSILQSYPDPKNPGQWEKNHGIYAGHLIMGKATKASKKFYWRLVIFLIADTFFLKFKRSKLCL